MFLEKFYVAEYSEWREKKRDRKVVREKERVRVRVSEREKKRERKSAVRNLFGSAANLKCFLYANVATMRRAK